VLRRSRFAFLFAVFRFLNLVSRRHFFVIV